MRKLLQPVLTFLCFMILVTAKHTYAGESPGNCSDYIIEPAVEELFSNLKGFDLNQPGIIEFELNKYFDFSWLLEKQDYIRQLIEKMAASGEYEDANPAFLPIAHTNLSNKDNSYLKIQQDYPESKKLFNDFFASYKQIIFLLNKYRVGLTEINEYYRIKYAHIISNDGKSERVQAGGWWHKDNLIDLNISVYLKGPGLTYNFDGINESTATTVKEGQGAFMTPKLYHRASGSDVERLGIIVGLEITRD